MAARKSTRKRTRKVWLPGLPTEVHTTMGVVPVQIVKEIPKDPDDNPSKIIFGRANYEHRFIQIRDGMHGATMHQVFWHEALHVALFDAGVQLTEDQVENVVDVIATFIVGNMVGNAPTKPPR